MNLSFRPWVPHFDDTPAEGREVLRRRKLLIFAWLIAIVCAVSLPVLLVTGARWFHAAGPLTFCILAVFVIAAINRGASLNLVSIVFVGPGMLVATGMAMISGRDGLAVTAWLSIAPLFALSIGGRRAGWAVLALTIALVTMSIVALEAQWFPPLIEGKSLFNRLGSVLGACVLGWALMRAYEIETEKSIHQLETRNRELVEARAEAERANRAKSDFLATISHEIRTPLNGVTGMATLLESESDPRHLREGLRVIRQSADVLLAVINDVLDFAKIESNALELESVPFSPANELRLVVDLLQSRAAERQTELELVLEGTVPPFVRGDPTRLRQVALNLVSNAVKFTERGTVTVRLTALDGLLSLEVRDTGIGMGPDALNRLFQPFAQADATTTRRFGGTGLGLVITRRLIEAMHGTITVESTPGEGSRFTVTVPVTPAVAPAAVIAAPARALVPRTVLLAEDNFVNQVVATRILEKMGHHVTVANDGAAAVELARTQAFDLVLMDCHMPVMDGYVAAKTLRASGFGSPIFALTAAVTQEDLARCTEVGMNGVLSKPLRLDRLNEVLDGLGSR